MLIDSDTWLVPGSLRLSLYSLRFALSATIFALSYFFHFSPCTRLILPPTRFLYLYHNLIFHVSLPLLVSILYFEGARHFRE